MIYPRLFEDFESRKDIDVSRIPFIDLRDNVLGVKDKKPIKVDDSEFLWRVDRKLAEDSIEWDYIWDLVKNLKYTKKIFSFINSELDIDVNSELDKAKKIRKRKRDGNPNFLPEIEIPLTFGEFWQNEIDNYDPSVSAKGEKQKNEKTDINIEQDFPEVFEYFTDRGKIDELTSFILNIPQSGGALLELKDLLRIFNEILDDESKIKIHKGSGDVYLPKNQYERWKEDMIEHIWAYESPENLNEVYKNNILKSGSFLNYLFNLKPDGIGRGEYMLVYTVPNSYLSGGSVDYDIEVLEQAIYEVKDYSKSGSGGDIRLGTHGKLSQFDFFQEIKKCVSVAKKIWENVGEENIKKIVGKYNFQYWKNMTSSENYNKFYKAIPSAVNAGELPPSRLKVIIDWCFLNHLLVEGEDETGDEYTMAILRGGGGIKPKTVKISPIRPEDIKKGKDIKVSELEDREKMFNELRSLLYIQDPHQLVDDLDNAPKDYFDKVLDKMENTDLEFFFLIFRPDEIKMLNDTDFNLATITQSSIKIQEGGKKELSAIQNAFKDYKKLGDKDASTEDFWDYYRREGQTNESYYPRLYNY